MKIKKAWAMPNGDTFKIKPIKEFIETHIFQNAIIVEPFAGNSIYGNVTNDINPDKPSIYHMDALEFLNMLPENSADFVLYDPPYSLHQAVEIYNSFGAELFDSHVGNMQYWSRCKDRIAKIVKPNGKCLCFGWNTNGIGSKRCFEMNEILIVSHGGSRNDTLCTLETKIADGKINQISQEMIRHNKRLF